MTPAEQRVIAELNRTGGNVAEVAHALGSSESYVHRIKRTHWRPQDATLENSLVPAATSSITALLPPDLDGVRSLREKTIEVIDKALTTWTQAELPELIDLKEVNKLFKTLLQYERALNQQTAPALNIFQDNRQNNIQITALIDELSKLDPDTLRAFAGVPEPVIIDVTPAKAKEVV